MSSCIALLTTNRFYSNQDASKTNKQLSHSCSFTDTLKDSHYIEWWKSFNDSVCDTIIEKVLRANYGIKLSVVKHKIYTNMYKRSGLNYYPSFSSSVGYRRERSMEFAISADIAAKTINLEKETESHNRFLAGIDVTYDLDVWGKFRAQIKDAKLKIQLAQLEQQSYINTIVAQTLTFYYTIQAQKQLIALLHRNIRLLESYNQVLKDRFTRGIGSTLDIDLTTQKIEALHIRINHERTVLYEMESGLFILMAKFPHEIDSIPNTQIPDRISDFVIPDSLSSEEIKKRPDIIAAELQLLSVQYAIGIAKASLFPSVILSANLHQTDKKLEDFFKKNSITGMLGITMNYSDKFKSVKRSVLNEKKLLYRNTVYEYKNRLITAFHEVEKALFNYKMTHEQLVSIKKQIHVSNHIFKEMDERYKNGLVLYQNLLDVQNDLFNAQEKKIVIENNLIMQKIGLHKAVGGEWE